MNPLASTICVRFVAPNIICESTSMPSLLLMSFIVRLNELAPSLAFISAFCAKSVGFSSFMRISLLTMRSYRSSRCSLGRSAPSSMPRLFRVKPSLVILFFTCGLCASVLSMMTENASTYAVSADLYSPGFCLQNLSANFSIRRSIFCDSPGKRKPSRNLRMPSSKVWSVKSIASTYACITDSIGSSLSPR